MTRFSWLSTSEEDTLRFGATLGRALKPPAWIGLSGPLGAGKTRLVQGVARGLEFRGRVRSPSFVLEHRYRGRAPIRHLDLYRLDDAPEDIAASWEEKDEEAVVLVEWAERVADPPAGAVRLAITPASEDARWILLEWDPADSPVRDFRLEPVLGNKEVGLALPDRGGA